MTELPPGGDALDAIRPGTVLREWRIKRLIARGGFGRVFEAERISWADSGSTRALKVFDPILSSAARSALLGEFRVLAQVRHPNLLRGEDAFDIDEGPLAGCVVFVLERGDADLAGDVAVNGPLPAAVVAGVGVAVARGLGALHDRGQLHGDVKPENVLRVGGVWKLGDFGVTTALEGSYALPAAATLDFRPPEVSGPDGRGRVHRSADIWALGVTLWIASTGRHPFVGDDAQLRYAAVVRDDRRPRVGIDPVLASLLDDACLAPNPRDRATASELARGLAAVLAGAAAPSGGSLAPDAPDAPDVSPVAEDPSQIATVADEPTRRRTEVAASAPAAAPAPPVPDRADVSVLPAPEGTDAPDPTGQGARWAGRDARWRAIRAGVGSGVVAGVVVEAASLVAGAFDASLAVRRALYAAMTVVVLAAVGAVVVRLRHPPSAQVAVGAAVAVAVVVVATLLLFGGP